MKKLANLPHRARWAVPAGIVAVTSGGCGGEPLFGPASH
jgi:hypothetical protein